MKASYLGLELSGPVIVSSSPYTSDMRQIELCARHGAGAVVLKSIFEEQILQHAAALERRVGLGVRRCGVLSLSLPRRRL